MFYMIVGFALFVVLLLVIVMLVFKKSEPEDDVVVQKKPSRTIDKLIEVLKQENKDVNKVEDALNNMIESFPFPEDDQEAQSHFKFVYFYAKNPLTTAKMIVQMQKKLSLINPKYAKSIEDFQMRGVDARKKKIQK